MSQNRLNIRGHACRVDLAAQRGVSKEDNELTTAAKTVFASSAPSFWFLLAMLAPLPLHPVIQALSAKFPDKLLSALHKAYEVIYDASATLIEVSEFNSVNTRHALTIQCATCWRHKLIISTSRLSSDMHVCCMQTSVEGC